MLLEEGRSPQGERGLKSDVHAVLELRLVVSLPAGGAWIEIMNDKINNEEQLVAPRRGSVD